MTWPTPSWWYQRPTITSFLLYPLSLAWLLGSRMRRFDNVGYQGDAHLILVGNATAGGAGKTPTAIALAELLASQKPAFITRGYGGRITDTYEVLPQDSPKAVGDEALLLASYAPTFIGKDRTAAANKAATQHQLLIMDDGLQNHPSLRRDTVLLIVDSEDGFGNGHIIPAGPLRETIPSALSKAHGIILIGDGPPPPACQKSSAQIFRARRTFTAGGLPLAGLRVWAFCGIARPERFFQALRNMGAVVVGQEILADHQPINSRLFKRMTTAAQQQKAVLMTTEKDMARLSPENRQGLYPLIMKLEFEHPQDLKNFLLNRMNPQDSLAQMPHL